MPSTTHKIPIQSWLTIFTGNGVAPRTAMMFARQMYKTHNTPEKLSLLSEPELEDLGITDKQERKQLLAALHKAGYKQTRGAKRSFKKADQAQAEGSKSAGVSVSGPYKKRKVEPDVNELLPKGPVDEGADYGSFEFNEVLDEEVLRSKSAVVNRAPLMTAWATVVAEALGFQREEALSIASVYTEMNAISKGVSIGVFRQGKAVGIEASEGGSQPFVDLMGRKIPLYRTHDSEDASWRALNAGVPASPSSAYSYIQRSFRQTLPYVMGALRLLANNYSDRSAELNKAGFALYAEFRPENVGWGERGKVSCETILSLRKESEATKAHDVDEKLKHADAGNDAGHHEPPGSKDTQDSKDLTSDEYEAAFDEDTSWMLAVGD
ncbi:hypothetical protein PUNSTDRAFT_100008 [Punctularia strigosozonata HHB-11173 SS5]|uniref:uncharacterized protein n=1 Tax=Punctularia strigosozonata (strain HHB-11173) TaxID=741275 RepID=UPI0004418479|nr:uncharacterized protein PUNSTDRAFT_100008 [Punctularia strigosozonata HHB-11173 SS5]EIN10463.1 hypothetical protein PUNSTDRAFT_100008 [Punctularia strigosozonata HHB-11173 SS5]